MDLKLQLRFSQTCVWCIGVLYVRIIVAGLASLSTSCLFPLFFITRTGFRLRWIFISVFGRLRQITQWMLIAPSFFRIHPGFMTFLLLHCDALYNTEVVRSAWTYLNHTNNLTWFEFGKKVNSCTSNYPVRRWMLQQKMQPCVFWDFLLPPSRSTDLALNLVCFVRGYARWLTTMLSHLAAVKRHMPFFSDCSWSYSYTRSFKHK